MSHSSRHVICRLADLPDQGARGFSFPGARFPDEYFLVRHNGAVYGYRNQCPHAGNFLNWKADAFLTRDRSLIMCAAHGALFEPGTGSCVAGPCEGRSLDRVRVAVEQDEIVAYQDHELTDI